MKQATFRPFFFLFCSKKGKRVQKRYLAPYGVLAVQQITSQKKTNDFFLMGGSAATKIWYGRRMHGVGWWSPDWWSQKWSRPPNGCSRGGRDLSRPKIPHHLTCWSGGTRQVATTKWLLSWWSRKVATTKWPFPRWSRQVATTKWPFPTKGHACMCTRLVVATSRDHQISCPKKCSELE